MTTKVINGKAIAHFESEPSPELIDAISKMVDIAYDNSLELRILNEKTLVSKKVCANCNSDKFQILGGWYKCYVCGFTDKLL